MDFGGHKLGRAYGAPGDSLRWTERPFRRLADMGDVSGLYPDGDSLVWMGAESVLVRYDRRLRRYGGHAAPFRTLIRGVRTRDDSLLYGGDTGAATLPAEVGFAHHDLRFQFGATSYERINGPLHNRDRPRQYRWQLVGFDDEWTNWTTELRADYTGLPPGAYTMRVQARNLYNVVGTEAQLSFTVLPPWYRTTWAYGLYGLLALALVAGTVRWRTRRLRKRQEELENTVAERTEQLEAQKDRLEEQAERLQELDEAKSRFFANVSHEFRTPLTLIRGPVRSARDALTQTDGDLAEKAEQLEIAERNVDRLQRLIDQILGLARLDAGTYQLDARPTDLSGETERIARRFEPLAERHDLTLRAEVGETAPDSADPVYVDREALEHVIDNLLSNAIKFTPEGGTVTVRVEETVENAAIHVADTGPGIPEDEQEQIFDRFRQVDDTSTRPEEGAGIGLAFAKDLVDLHGGTLTLDSAGGEGTTVTARFPRGPDHLADAHRADDDTPAASTPNASPSTQNPQPSTPNAPPKEDDTPDDQSKLQNPNSKIVLVVDDNADVRRYVRQVLRPEYEVIE
ncbi:MAG: ATP-binding protein, partial [Salinibacter sp.]